MEWKYVRGQMMTEYIIKGAVLPPPFNLIPDVWLFLSNENQQQKVVNAVIEHIKLVAVKALFKFRW